VGSPEDDLDEAIQQEIERRVQADISVHGWHVVKIEGDEYVPPWAHTIGFGDSFGHPEVLVAGMAVEQLHTLLNRIGDLLRAGNRFEADQQVHSILEVFPCAFKRVDARWHQAFAGNAAWHHRDTGLALLQCFWPDPEGRFPWDSGYPDDLKPLQPLLYEAAAERALAPGVRETLESEGVI
jgi:hypothetical protein